VGSEIAKWIDRSALLQALCCQTIGPVWKAGLKPLADFEAE
jgi:hypothetical protein